MMVGQRWNGEVALVRKLGGATLDLKHVGGSTWYTGAPQGPRGALERVTARTDSDAKSLVALKL